MRTLNLLRAGFGFTALLVAAVGAVSTWGTIRGIEETALEEAGGVVKILTHLVLGHPGPDPLVSHRAEIQADIMALHALHGRDIEVVDRSGRIVEFHLGHVLDQTMRTLAPRAHQKGLEMAYHEAPDVPAAVTGDPARLRQILVNLVSNAVKFTQAGESDGRADLGGKSARPREPLPLHDSVRGSGRAARPPAAAPGARSRGNAALIVDDNATSRRILEEILTTWGMRPTVVDGGAAALRAMELAHQAGRPFPLVLLDYQMPDMDGFEVAAQIAQRPDLAGATIMMPSSVREPGEALRCHELGGAAVPNKPVRQSALLDAILAALARPSAGPEPPTPAAHPPPPEAQTPPSVPPRRSPVAAVEAERPDLVLMDIQMPEMDGFAATAAIREGESARPGNGRLPIVALTALVMKGDRERCLAAGMDGYLANPIRRDQLATVLARITGEAADSAEG